MKLVYMCHGGFKNRGLRERPLTGNGGFQNWPTREKGGFVAKNNKETYIFLKGGTLRAAHVYGAWEVTFHSFYYCVYRNINSFYRIIISFYRIIIAIYRNNDSDISTYYCVLSNHCVVLSNYYCDISK